MTHWPRTLRPIHITTLCPSFCLLSNLNFILRVDHLAFDVDAGVFSGNVANVGFELAFGLAVARSSFTVFLADR